MAFIEVDEPAMLDSTGQDIVTAINNLGSAISPSASNVTFNNTGTDLTSSNAESAIKEVREKSFFQYHATMYGSTYIDLPSNWTEMLIQVSYNGSYITSYFLRNMFDQERTVSFGNYGTSYCLGNVSKTKAKINTLVWGGSNVTSSAVGYVYLR